MSQWSWPGNPNPNPPPAQVDLTLTLFSCFMPFKSICLPFSTCRRSRLSLFLLSHSTLISETLVIPYNCRKLTNSMADRQSALRKAHSDQPRPSSVPPHFPSAAHNPINSSADTHARDDPSTHIGMPTTGSLTLSGRSSSIPVRGHRHASQQHGTKDASMGPGQPLNPTTGATSLDLMGLLQRSGPSVVKTRNGSVLSRGFILKTDHYPSGLHSLFSSILCH